MEEQPQSMLIAFLEWLEEKNNLILCVTSYAGEMVESGADRDKLVQDFLKSCQD